MADGGMISNPLVGYLPPHPDALRGHGLWMVTNCCDLIQIRTDSTGSRIRFHLALT